LLNDTLSHPAVQVAAGAVPIGGLPDLHSLGQTAINYGGALIASVIIHLITKLLFKSKTSNVST